LWIRWYKMTSEAGIEKWISELAQRSPAPLAVLGGGSSDRARDLAPALAGQTSWKGDPPLLLITTATADRLYLAKEKKFRKLIETSPGRSFRFCFTNSQMAGAIRDFIWSRAALRPYGAIDPRLVLTEVTATGGDLWSALGLLNAAERLQ